MKDISKDFSELVGKTLVDQYGNKHVIPNISKSDAVKNKRKAENKVITEYQQYEPRLFLKENSMLNEKDVLNRKFKDLNRISPAFQNIAKQVKDIANDFKNGERYNVFFEGKQGRGKTTLAACLINDVTNNSKKPTNCAIINASRIAELVNTYDDSDEERQQKKSNLNIFLRRLKNECDILVIDDLGKESNMQSEISEANNTIQRMWYRIGDIMLDPHKATIITSNLPVDNFSRMYDHATLSRLFRGTSKHTIIFDSQLIPDSRMSEL